MSYSDSLRVLNQFLAKSDGKDKLTATIQYACMFLATADSTNIKKIQSSVTAARKIFRVLKPLETITPLLLEPGVTGRQPLPVELLAKLKSILLAMYFGADHVVWAHQIGLVNSKDSLAAWQKVSLWSWALGSVAAGLVEVYNLSQVDLEQREGESAEEYGRRQELNRTVVNQKLLLVIHCTLQTLLAAGLLNFTSLSPRAIGFIGTVTSGLNCYMLMPAMPKAKTA